MNDKLIQLVERLWSLDIIYADKYVIRWNYKNYAVFLRCTTTSDDIKFTITVEDQDYLLLFENVINLDEKTKLEWKLKGMNLYKNFSNRLIDTLLEEDDASCFDDLLETNKNE